MTKDQEIIIEINKRYHTQYQLSEDPIGEGGVATVYDLTGYKAEDSDTREYVCRITRPRNSDQRNNWEWIQKKIALEYVFLTRPDTKGTYVGKLCETYVDPADSPQWYVSIQKKFVELKKYYKTSLESNPSIEDKDFFLCKIFCELAESLDYIHNYSEFENNQAEKSDKKGLLLRDIKPENIMYDPEIDRCIMCDFNIAREYDPQNPWVKTITNLFGTANYMAPELYRIEGGTETQPHPRQDIYSLGATIFNLATDGKETKTEPPTGSNAWAKEISDDDKKQELDNTKISKELIQIIYCSILSDPDDRYQMAIELLRYIKPLYGYLESEKKLAKSQSDLEKINNQLDSVTRELAETQDEKEKLEDWISEAKQEIARKQAEIEDQKSTIERLKKEPDRLRKELSEEITSSATDKELIKRYLDRIESLTEEQEKLENKIKNASVEKENLEQEIDTLKKLMEDLQTQLREYENRNNNIEDRNAQLNKENEALKSTNNRIRKENKRLEKKVETLNKRLDRKGYTEGSEVKPVEDIDGRIGKRKSYTITETAAYIAVVAVSFAVVVLGILAIPHLLSNETFAIRGIEFNTWAKQYFVWCSAFIGAGFIISTVLEICEVKKWSMLIISGIVLLAILWPTVLGAPGLVKDIALEPEEDDGAAYVKVGDTIEASVTPLLCSHIKTNYECSGQLALDDNNAIRMVDKNSEDAFLESTIVATAGRKRDSRKFVLDNTENVSGLLGVLERKENGVVERTVKYSYKEGITLQDWTYSSKIDVKDAVLEYIYVETTSDGKRWNSIGGWSAKNSEKYPDGFPLENEAFSYAKEKNTEPTSDVKEVRITCGFDDTKEYLVECWDSFHIKTD